jgi:hypothetical protein
MLKEIASENEVWAHHKRDCMAEMMSVLRARSPLQRQRRILKYFGERDWRSFRYSPSVLSALPDWLAAG